MLSLTVLVVDDDPVFLDVTASVLAARSHKVVTAANGETALAAFETHRPPLVLIDWMLPDTDGPALCRRLRELPYGRECVVMMVTGRDGTTHVLEALAAGVDDYLQKPFDVATFAVRMAVIEQQVAALLQRTTMEKALRLSEERFDLAARGAAAGIWDWDFDDDVLYLSPGARALSGYASEELPQSIDEAFALAHPDDLALLRHRLHLHLTLDHPFRVEMRFRHASGEWRWFENSGQVARDPHGRPEHMAGALIDIDARVKAQQNAARLYAEVEAARLLAEERADELEIARARAQDADRQKSAFLATMSHEIRTPMNGVVCMVDLLLATPLSTEQREYADTVRSSAESLLSLIDDILDLSKIEAGKLTLEAIAFDLPTAIEEAVFVLSGRAAAKGLELNCAIASDVPTAVCGDPTRLRQVIVNLVGNAVKFTETGEVFVSVQVSAETATDTTITMLVRDTGIGLAPEAIERLFQPFAQADGTVARQYGGTGLGLAICRRLVEAMGGTIGVDSAPGDGSTFWFRVPFARVEAVATPEAPWHDRHVAVVMAHPSTRLVLRGYLDDLGATTVAAADLDELRRHLDAGVAIDALAIDRGLLPLPPDLAARVGARPVVPVTLPGEPAIGAGPRLMKPIRRRAVREALALDASTTVAAPVDAAPYPPPARNVALLVADDNEVNRRVLRATLRKLGYEPDVVRDGREAVEAVRRKRYDLVFMDCQMPLMDGFQATAAIRADAGAGRRLPIVALTANAMRGDRERCLDAGMDDYVAKPMRAEDVHRVITTWCTDRSAPAAVGPAAPPAALATEPVTVEDPAIDHAGLDALRTLLREPEDGDASFQTMIEEYLCDARLACESARTALLGANAGELARIAHKLKGSSATFGAPGMRAISTALEELARSGSTDGAEPLIGSLAAELTRVERELIAYR